MTLTNLWIFIHVLLIPLVINVNSEDQLLNVDSVVNGVLNKINKRLKAIETALDDHTKEKCKLSIKENASSSNQGSVYVRWGGSTCGNAKADTELIYSGQVVGSDYEHEGAAVNRLCLPRNPLWSHYDSNRNANAYVYGAEIHTNRIDMSGTPWEMSKYNTKGISCAVCKTNGRNSVMMIPGRNRCYNGWTREYHGYLSAGYHAHPAGSEYVCLDAKPIIHPTQKHVWHSMFYSVEARCDGVLACPPYVDGRELTCVVCSK